MTHIDFYMKGWLASWSHKKEPRMILKVPYVFMWVLHDTAMRRMKKMSLNCNYLQNDGRAP